MLRYPVKLVRDDNGTLLVTAPDVPEVGTFGSSVPDALARASDAIATALQGRIRDRKDIPVPSARKRGQHAATLPAIIAAKLALYKAMVETGIGKIELARKLSVHGPQIDRILDLNHNSRLDQIEEAAKAIGREVHIELRPAA